MNFKKIAFIGGVTIIVIFTAYLAVKHFSSPPIDMVSVVAEYNKGDLDKTIADGEKLVASDNTNIKALVMLATAYAEKGNLTFNENEYGKKAIETANKVLAININDAQALQVVGYANEIMGNYEEALRNYDRVVGIAPESAQGYSNKGHVYDLQGDHLNAETWYKKALAIDPKNDHALVNLARIDMRKNDFVSASSSLNIVVNTSTNVRMKASAYQLLAVIESKPGSDDYSNAISLLKKALELDPLGLPQAYVSLADVYIKNISNVESKEAYQKTIVDAKAVLSKSLSINPNQASAYYLLSKIAFIEGDDASSSMYRQKALDAIPQDITLGEKEKESLKETVGVVVSNIKATPITNEEYERLMKKASSTMIIKK